MFLNKNRTDYQRNRCRYLKADEDLTQLAVVVLRYVAFEGVKSNRSRSS